MTGAEPVEGIVAADAPPRVTPSSYPPLFVALTARRQRRPLGDLFGLVNFGVNHTRIAPGGASALRHAHTQQDEFVYVLEGRPTLITDAGETALGPGMCAGFRAGTGDAHHLVNRTDADVVLLEIGDRSPGDLLSYPDDDIQTSLGPDGKLRFTRKDGQAF